ncbi:MAG: S9 family peptidase [Pseudomonadota bacterium]
MAMLLQLAGLSLGSAAWAGKLSIERLFAAPDLAGETLRGARLSPDGRLVTYLKAANDNKDRLDLWAYDIATRRHRLLVDSLRLQPQAAALSAEEIARRERQRSSSLSGILEYSFSADSHLLLVPLGGDLYLYDLRAAADRAVQRLTNTAAGETDAQFSPRGHYVSFIREQNLYVLDVATGTETAITTAGRDLVSYGMADFLAQEEMHRYTGYWWAPDESRIAYERFDESTVAETQRYEINARDVTVVRQRYPYAGTTNPAVTLFVAQLAKPATPVAVDLGSDPDIYLARVEFFPDSKFLAVQRQTRNQQQLDLLKTDASTGQSRVLLTERSSTWVPLHDDLTFLKKSPRFIWASARSGYKHLYLYDLDGKLLRPLTSGEHMVVGNRELPAIRGVDEARGLVYFMSNRDSTVERQLYRLPLAQPERVERITQGKGWHSIAMSKDASIYLDTFSNSETPPNLTLHSADGRLRGTLVANALVAGHPYFPYLDEHSVSEFGQIPASDGQMLNYQLIKPRHMTPGKRYPVVIDVYGGPDVQNVTNTWSSDAFNQYLASEGYVIFALDNRGGGARGERFETALYHKMGTVEVQDQLTGVRFLRTLPFVDPARIGIFGWSYGGYMALLCVMQSPESFAAAVSGAPVTDWRLYDTHYTERYMGKPQDNVAGYDASDVLKYADKLSRPLLLMHGMADDNVLFTHTTTLMQKLQQDDRPFELMTYPGGKHGLLRHADMGPHALHAIKSFLDRTLRDAP